MIPKIIHRIWLGGNPLPEQAQIFEETFKRHNPGWEMRLWDERELEIHKIPFRNLKTAGPSSLANVLRVEIVRKFGGHYVDCDVECLKPLDSLCLNQAYAGIEEAFLGNAVFGAVAHHPWLESMSRDWGKVIQRPPPWGPRHMDKHARLWPVTFYPRRYFYPWLWEQRDKKKAQIPHKDSLMAHYWNMSWKYTASGEISGVTPAVPRHDDR